MKRKLIREMVEQYLLQEVSIAKQKHPFKAILMTGPAGAGKSFTSKRLLGVPSEVMRFTLNPDDIIEYLFPKFDVSLKFVQDADDPVGKAQAELRNIAKVGTMSKAAGYINRAKPLYIDTTAQEPERIIPVLDKLIELGYDIGIIKVFVPRETSVARDQARERTVGRELTGKIWDDYNKNVIQDKAYDNWAAGQQYAKVLNPDGKPFVNVFNLGTEDVRDDEGNLIAKARSKVEDVKGDVDVTVEEMDRVISDLRKGVSDFLKPMSVPNPVGKDLYDGMKELLKISKGRLGNELTDLYTVAIDAPAALDIASIEKAINRLGAITGEVDLEKSLETLGDIIKQAARGKAKGVTARTATQITSKLKDETDADSVRPVAEAIARQIVEKLKKKLKFPPPYYEPMLDDSVYPLDEKEDRRGATPAYCKRTPCKKMGFTQKASCKSQGIKDCYRGKNK